MPLNFWLLIAYINSSGIQWQFFHRYVKRTQSQTHTYMLTIAETITNRSQRSFTHSLSSDCLVRLFLRLSICVDLCLSNDSVCDASYSRHIRTHLKPVFSHTHTHRLMYYTHIMSLHSSFNFSTTHKNLWAHRILLSNSSSNNTTAKVFFWFQRRRREWRKKKENIRRTYRSKETTEFFFAVPKT